MDRNTQQKSGNVPETKKDSMTTVRFSASEKDELSKRALLCQMTIADYIRQSLFGKTPLSIADRENVKKEAPQILKNIKNQHKSLADDYHDICRVFIAYMGLKNDEGQSLVRDKNVIEYFKNLVSLSLSMQRILNRMLSYFGQKEEHFITPYPVDETIEKELKNEAENEPKTAPAEGRKSTPEWPNGVSEMMLIRGRLMGDPSSYKDKKGNGKTAFTIACNSGKDDQKKLRKYNVYAGDSLAGGRLKKGTLVQVSGVYSENDKGDRMIFAQTLDLL